MSKMGGVLIASAANIPETRDTSLEPSVVSRDTKGGRRLWYCLRVIQQPERARACGSGPKSSADRRPVDPPPVVELRIYEGQNWEQAQEKDITFVYNANFFLFATLEHARVMAHARGTPAPSNTPPVLTGMPVSGMAYLDRPQEAGYFLFPDLSVRHEGRYKLTFNLYEETKEDKDKDKALDDESQPSNPGLTPATGGSFDFRMEVKSQEFIVYSAKKFPGLAESTALSRVVAEQGCRVRIRRDVRMRRRDGKGGGDFDNVEDEYTRRRRTATPERQDYNNRARSMSGSTERTPYTADPQRRPSIADYPTQYPPNPPPGGHLQFLGGNASSQYPAAPPPQSFARPPSVPASPVYPPPGQANPYPLQPAYAPPPPPPVAPKPSHSRERTPSQSRYPPINPAPPRRDSAHHDYRPQLPPLSVPSYHPPTAQQQQQQQQPLHMAPPKPQVLPSLQTDNLLSNAGRLPLPIPSPTSTARPPTSALAPAPAPIPALPTLMPSIASITNLASIAPAPAPTSAHHTSSTKLGAGPLHPATLPPPAQYAGTKRAHDQSFRQEAEPGTRFQDGARDKGVSEDLAPTGSEPMWFKRADGSTFNAMLRL